MESKSKSSPSPSSTYHAPAHDPFHLVLIICLILGCGTLLAYNALVSCTTYFNHQFPDYPDIEFTIVPVFSIPNLIFIVLMIPFGDRFSWNFKILGCFSVLAVLVLSIPYISDPQWNVFGLSQTGGYYAFLAIVAVIGCTSAVLQCSITAFCGLLPVTYLQTVLAGQSVSGVLVCVIRIFSKLLLPLSSEGIEKSGKLYFMVSSGVCIVCALSFYYARHSEFVKFHVSGLTAISSPRSRSTAATTTTHRARPVMRFPNGLALHEPPQRISLGADALEPLEAIEVFEPFEAIEPIEHSLIIPVFPGEDASAPLRAENEHTASYGAVDHSESAAPLALTESAKKYGRVFLKTRHLILSIWACCAVTFSWFPGVVTLIPSSFAELNDNGQWMAIIMILEFNVFDYVGRQFLCNVVPRWLTQHGLWKLALLRIVTYPVFIVFARRWVQSDALLHCVMILSALSNGYVASLSFMWFPQNIKKNEQQIAASLMTLGLISGILSGSAVALCLRPFIL